MEKLCRQARSGTVAVQLRDCELSTRERHALGLALRRITSEHGQALWVNDRLDIALLLRADAVHLGEQGLDVQTARSFVQARKANMLISEAVHDPERRSTADAILLSPIFESRKGAAALGLSALSRYQQVHSGQAVYALGGATPENAGSATGAGARGIAAISAPYREPAALLAALRLLR